MSLRTAGAFLFLAVGGISGLGFWLADAGVEPRRSDEGSLSWEQARLFAEVMQRVKHDYVRPVDDSELLESAIRGMVSGLDPHSEFLDEEQYREIRVSTSGRYSGVGIEVSAEDSELKVITPIDNTPAQRAGIRSGDTILSVDGVPVDPGRMHETIERMRGHPGTQVRLTIGRASEEEPLLFTMRRESIQMASVHHELLEPTYGYVRISQFNETTPDELRGAVDELLEQVQRRQGTMLTGLVLDLRNNPGGILDAAVEVVDLFLDSGVIVTAEGRTPEARFVRRARRGDILDGASVVVLVNEGSASAAEIVAGALQDQRRALIVGTVTFGKGLVQTVMPLSKGRALKLTTSRYFTPSGDSIHHKGISPDVFVESTGDYPAPGMSSGVDREHDAQLGEALERLRSLGVMHSKVT
ncbi:MAG TPA: S41 family peptidase [Woeseiaceae bacterium]|nr:S41 family peptidase [Woeseiaceae bacterium]